MQPPRHGLSSGAEICQPLDRTKNKNKPFLFNDILTQAGWFVKMIFSGSVFFDDSPVNKF